MGSLMRIGFVKTGIALAAILFSVCLSASSGSINLPRAIPVYITASALPALAADGSPAITLDTDVLYIYNLPTMLWIPVGAASGTVTSVGFADGSTSAIFTITGSPVTGAGTLTETLKVQPANTFFAGPTSGGSSQPTFRAIVASDLPVQSAITPATPSTNVERDTNGLIEDVDPSFTMSFYDEFLGYTIAGLYWAADCAGSGCGAANTAGGGPNVDSGHLGIAYMHPGTSTSGNASLNSGIVFFWGGGTAVYDSVMQQPVLCDAVTDDCEIRIGFGDSFSGSTPYATGIWFSWDPAVNSSHWVVHSCVSSTCQNDNTAVGPSAATWTHLKFIVNAAATGITWYVDGSLVDTMSAIAAKIPHTTAQNTDMKLLIIKSAGTNDRKLYVDYVKYTQTLTTPR